MMQNRQHRLSLRKKATTRSQYVGNLRNKKVLVKIIEDRDETA